VNASLVPRRTNARRQPMVANVSDVAAGLVKLLASSAPKR
jgi:hypothetical protein